jgi:methyl-accepting chemotaxis protein
MNFLEKISIKNRLIGSFTILLLMLAAIVLLGVYNSNNTQASVKKIVEQDFAKFKMAAAIDSLTKSNARNTLEVFLVEQGERKSIQDEMSSTRLELDKIFAELEPMLYTAEGKALFQELKDRRSAYVSAFGKAINTLNTDPVLAQIILKDEVLPAVDALATPVTKIKDLQEDLANKSAGAIDASLDFQTLVSLSIGAIAIIVALLVSWALIRAIMRPLQQAVDIAGTIGKGDLTMRIETTGDHELTRLLQSLKAMQSHLSSVLGNIQESTVQVASASSQIAAANLDLSARTEAQASSLEQTAASMEEITASVQQNQQITQTASQLSNSASRDAQTVGQRVEEVVQMIGQLHTSSEKIRDIISVIDSIAFQTNILALNAAVEAARAGEQGRGFAVVASEVRALAQRSAQAAQEIKTIIQDNTQKMQSGSELAHKAGDAVKSVVGSIERVNATVSEVAMSTREQAEGIDQIGQAVVQLDQATQQNAALVEETTAATTNLNDQVQSLKQEISRFRIGTVSQEVTDHGKRDLMTSQTLALTSH